MNFRKKNLCYWISTYRDVVCVWGILELKRSMQVVDEMKSSDVDPPNSERVHFTGDDRNQVDRVKTEWNDQRGVAEAKSLLKQHSNWNLK